MYMHGPVIAQAYRKCYVNVKSAIRPANWDVMLLIIKYGIWNKNKEYDGSTLVKPLCHCKNNIGTLKPRLHYTLNFYPCRTKN